AKVEQVVVCLGRLPDTGIAGSGMTDDLAPMQVYVVSEQPGEEVDDGALPAEGLVFGARNDLPEQDLPELRLVDVTGTDFAQSGRGQPIEVVAPEAVDNVRIEEAGQIQVPVPLQPIDQDLPRSAVGIRHRFQRSQPIRSLIQDVAVG